MVKTLSISADTPGATASKTKVLSIDVPTPAPSAAKNSSADDGAKVAAAKAIEKTEKSATGTSGTTSPSPSSGRSSPTAAEVREAKREADAVAIEQAAEVEEEILEDVYGKEHVNLIFIGHVDAGKSTLGGSILYATGMVDERTMDKYKREAKDAGRETWYLSWALDLTKEERSKGKTVEVGRGFFETEKRRYTILDAPGHKTFVPNMIAGASQADVGILVISARKGEYETGFEKGGQTREHAILAKTQGVNKLIVVVNKMDDQTVEWSHERYKECTEKLLNFLSRQVGYGKSDITFMPISAQTTVGIKDRVSKDLAPWYDGPSLLECLDNFKTLERKVKAPFMMPINAKYRDMGTIMEGKIEAGQIKKGNNYLLMVCTFYVDGLSLFIRHVLPLRHLSKRRLLPRMIDADLQFRSPIVMISPSLHFTVRQKTRSQALLVVIKYGYVFVVLRKRTFYRASCFARHNDPSTAFQHLRRRSLC